MLRVWFSLAFSEPSEPDNAAIEILVEGHRLQSARDGLYFEQAVQISDHPFPEGVAPSP